ncbi:MAG: MFS transporter [Armatimonadetes bacterium]|nr:MFS transporter [Armatimonadota bacterium]
MQGEEDSLVWDHPVPPKGVAKAIKLSYAQSILCAFYGIGGGIVMAYMIKLGASDEQIGLLSTLPMYAVFVQLLAAVMVEKGACRKRMTVIGSLSGVFCWGLVIALPFLLKHTSASTKVTGLIAVFTLISVFGHLANNARASWIGDLIPSHKLGSFFGRLALYGGLIAAILAIIQGRFLDYMKGAGISAFGWIFAFAMVFGVANAILYIPQPDVKSVKHDLSLLGLVSQTLRNRSLMAFVAFAAFWNMQSIAWPFYAPYLLRGVGLSYTTFSMLGTIQGIIILISSPYWGRMVNKHGCRPVIIFCALITAPMASAWIWISTPHSAYIGVPIVNVLTGFANGGIGVAISTIIYKVTTQAGRSVQMAIYSVVITLLIAPMPVLGGHLPGWLKSLGLHVDLRCTFYISQLFCIAAIAAACKVKEPGSSLTAEMVCKLIKTAIKRRGKATGNLC